jgi:hypothetical protein
MVRYQGDDQPDGPSLPDGEIPRPANEPSAVAALVWFLVAVGVVLVITVLAHLF